MAVKSIIIRQDQTIYDMAIQLYGSVEKVYKIIADNPEITSLQDTIIGKTIVYDEQSTTLTNHFKVNDITIVTEGVTTGSVDTPQGLLADDGQQLLAGDGQSLFSN